MIQLVFWAASLLVVYPYVGYPLLLRGLVAVTPWRSRSGAHPQLPSVTLVVSAYNEQDVIAAKLANALQLDYPADRLEVVVVSDASTDRTDEIVRKAAARDARVSLLRQPERRGKSAGLNHAVAAARGEVVVFSDANAMYERDALRELVAPLADPEVGYVVGAALYTDAHGNRAAESEGLYWRLELLLKSLESRYHSVVGGDGAIYAIRGSLFEPLRDDDISDFVNPLQIVARGYRGVFNPHAVCREEAGNSFDKERGRKRRIVNRSWRAVRRYGGRLSLRRHPRFLFMLWSHKVLRWFALPLVAIAWVANCALLGAGPVYVATWLAINASLALAVWGRRQDRLGRLPGRLASLAYYFYTVNLAGMLGIWDEFRGRRHVTWEHVRRPGH